MEKIEIGCDIRSRGVELGEDIYNRENRALIS